MKTRKKSDFRVTRDILPLSDFKAHASQVLSSVHEHGRSVVITQNGKPAAVLISPEEFDRYQEREDFVAAVSEGRDDAKQGRTHSIKDVEAILDKKFGKMK